MCWHQISQGAWFVDFTCETLKTQPQHGQGPSDAAHPEGTAQGGSDPDDRSGRWTPGRPPSGSRVECTLLRYTPECARAYSGWIKHISWFEEECHLKFLTEIKKALKSRNKKTHIIIQMFSSNVFFQWVSGTEIIKYTSQIKATFLWVMVQILLNHRSTGRNKSLFYCSIFSEKKKGHLRSPCVCWGFVNNNPHCKQSDTSYRQYFHAIPSNT